MPDTPRTVHYVGFRDDRYWSAFRVFGGPRMIHRRFDRYAVAEIGPNDIVVFAEGDETQPIVRGAADLDERWLLRSTVAPGCSTTPFHSQPPRDSMP